MPTPNLTLVGELTEAQIDRALVKLRNKALPMVCLGNDLQAVLFRGSLEVAEEMKVKLSSAFNRYASRPQERIALQAVMSRRHQTDMVVSMLEAERQRAENLRSEQASLPLMMLKVVDEQDELVALLQPGDARIDRHMVTVLKHGIDRVEAIQELALSNPDRPLYSAEDSVLFHDYSVSSARLGLATVISSQWGKRMAEPLAWYGRDNRYDELTENIYTIRQGEVTHTRSESELLLPTTAEIHMIKSFSTWLDSVCNGDRVEAQEMDHRGSPKRTVFGVLNKAQNRNGFNDFPTVTTETGHKVSASGSYDLLIGPNGEQPVSLQGYRCRRQN